MLSSDGWDILGSLAWYVWYVSSHAAEQPPRLPFMPPDEPKTKHHDGLRCLMPYLMNCNLTNHWAQHAVLLMLLMFFVCLYCLYCLAKSLHLICQNCETDSTHPSYSSEALIGRSDWENQLRLEGEFIRETLGGVEAIILGFLCIRKRSLQNGDLLTLILYIKNCMRQNTQKNDDILVQSSSFFNVWNKHLEVET